MTGLSELAASAPLDALNALENGEKAILAGETEKGIEIYQSILEIYPDNKVARERVRKLGVRPSIKPPKLSRKRSASPEKIKSLMAVADSGNTLGALRGLNELIQQFPRDSALYFLIGNIQRELGRISASVESYEISVDLNPKYSDAHLNLGRSYFELRDLEQSSISLEKAIELNRRNYLAFYYLGVLKEEVRETDSAIENYLRSLRIKPDHPESNNNLGKILLDRQEFQRADKFFARAKASL